MNTDICDRIRYIHDQLCAAQRTYNQLLLDRPLMLDPAFRLWEERLAAEKLLVPLLEGELLELHRQLPRLPVSLMPVHGMANVA